MPGPTIAGIGNTYEVPPISIREISPELHEYLLVVHHRLFGIGGQGGDLAPDNVDSDALGLHGESGHKEITKAAAVADASETGVVWVLPEITNADAGGTYGAPERNLINEMKTDLNTFFTDFDLILSSLISTTDRLNELLAALRTSKALGAE